MENRKHPRKPIRLPLELSVGEGPRVAGQCSDLSLGGMYVETSASAAYGANVTLFVALPDLQGEARIEATVRWTKPGGMGLQFSAMGARETHGITELLSKAG